MSDQIDETLNSDNDQTNPNRPEFDFSSFPSNSLFHERREGRDRRFKRTPTPEQKDPASPTAPAERRAKKERRRRIDPTTFEKQYTDDEIEFMNAMQRFKEHTGNGFPTHGDVLKVAAALGYRQVVFDPENCWGGAEADAPSLVKPSTIEAGQI
ncbi:MAG: hypothetical protein ACHRXM_09035 [Isosphaerales bacterium]